MASDEFRRALQALDDCTHYTAVSFAHVVAGEEIVSDAEQALIQQSIAEARRAKQQLLSGDTIPVGSAFYQSLLAALDL